MWLDPPISLATWLCDCTSFSWEKLLSTDTGRVIAIRKSADMFGKRFYQTVSVKKMQNLQWISSKQLYTEFLCLRQYIGHV